jgi:hypothetical protein
MKLHLDSPRAEGSDRPSLLNFWDVFPRLPKFAAIKPRDFKPRPRRNRTTKIGCAEVVEEFGNIEDEMDAAGSDEECI